MSRIEIEDDSDYDETSTHPVDEDDSDEEEAPIEDDPIIKRTKANWKFLGVLASLFHRSLLEDSNLRTNLIVKERKPELYTYAGDPTILNVSNVDFFSYNLTRQFHQTFDADIQYLQTKDGIPTTNPNEYHQLSNRVKDILEKLEAGVITISEYIHNFISDTVENMYDTKVRKVIEYFVRQREYYLAIGRVRVKYDGGEGNPPKVPPRHKAPDPIPDPTQAPDPSLDPASSITPNP